MQIVPRSPAAGVRAYRGSPAAGLRAYRRRPVAAAALGCLLLVAGCGSVTSGQATLGTPASTGPAGTALPAAATSATVTPATVTPGTGSAARATVTKILVIMEENHSAGQVFPSGMPYLWKLARRFGRATAWRAIGHPSLPNYLAILAGSAFNYPSDCAPAAGCRYPGPTVFGQAVAAGRTARAYEESMPSRCAAVSSGPYDVNHNPWAYFPAEARLCRSRDVPAGTPARGRLAADARAGSLPDVGLVTPDVNHDAHNGTLAAADAWLRSWLPVLMSGPDWRARRLAIAIVFDEAEATQRVPFVLIAPGVSGAVDRRPANHYALTRLIDEIARTRLLRKAATAANIAPSLGLRLPRRRLDARASFRIFPNNLAAAGSTTVPTGARGRGLRARLVPSLGRPAPGRATGAQMATRPCPALPAVPRVARRPMLRARGRRLPARDRSKFATIR